MDLVARRIHHSNNAKFTIDQIIRSSEITESLKNGSKTGGSSYLHTKCCRILVDDDRESRVVGDEGGLNLDQKDSAYCIIVPTQLGKLAGHFSV